MKTLNYRVILKKEIKGGYTVIVPSLSGCITYGDTVDEAMEKAPDLSGVLKSKKHNG